MVSSLVAFALFSCGTEQGGPAGEEPPPREVTKEVTKTVTVAEAPRTPKAQEDARAALAPAESPPDGSGPDYVTVADGALSVEVPSSWAEVETGAVSEAGSSWSEFAGESVDYSLTAAPSLDSWSSAAGTLGIYAVASAGLAQRYNNEDLVAAGPHDLSGACEAGARRAFERDPYSGLVQEWANCGEAGGGYLTLAAMPRDGGCVVLMTVGTAGSGGEAAGQHALETFGSDCGAPASYPLSSADEQYAPEQYAPLIDQDVSNADECAVRGLDFESNTCVTPADLEETCAALGKVRAGRGCVFPEDSSDAPEPLPGDGERVPSPTDQYETPVQGEPPPSSSGYPPFPGDPFDGPTCDEVGGGPYSVPPGSPRDSDDDGIACE